MKFKNNRIYFILLLGIILTLVSIYLAVIYTPPHELMGDVQRIFYFHVASAWISYLAFGITFVTSLFFLKTKDLKWDKIASSSVEIGIVFCTLGIVTGSTWAGAVWGVFWIWEDFKLFTTLVLWLVFIAYIAIRTNAKSKNSKAKLSAVFGIIGFICIPFSFAANRIWQQYHPSVIVTSKGSLQPSMAFTLVTAVIAFTFLFIYLLIVRFNIEEMKDNIEIIKQYIGGRNV